MVHRRSDAVDEALARRLRAGEESALGELYDTHREFVYGLALRVVGDATAAEDVTQEVFVGVWADPTRYDPDRGTLRAYLGTLTHRRAVDHIRSEEARRRREARGVSAHPRPATPELDQRILDGETAGLVRRALAGLPDAQRTAVELAYFGGHTYRQVADRLGIPEGTAKSRLRLGLARIAEALEPDLHERWT